MTQEALKKLEAFHNKHLRALLKRPAFLFHDTNTEVREMIGAYSIHSQLRARRLHLFRRMSLSPHTHVAAFAVLWGKRAGSTSTPTTPWGQQLHKDIQVAMTCLEQPPVVTLFPKEMHEWIKLHSKAQLNTTLSTSSPVDPKLRKQPQLGPAEIQRCPLCAYGTTSIASLRLHVIGVHKYRNLVLQLITSPQCPVCLKWFKSLKSARAHYMRQCHQYVPEALIQQLLLQHQKQLAAPPGPVQHTLHQYFTRVSGPLSTHNG